ncbi:putative sodium-dependent transporter YocS [Neiella marina]|uniref:Putative sodium-dependent transporter YocS n=1 Tax=Neiella marina TaxID=508461 RepID=A0A8J2XM39_9GAMM|nr:putative sodium-dependent transporter YocS [Neiella marina]
MGLIAGFSCLAFNANLVFAGLLITVALLLLALGLQQTKHLSSISFTVFIFAAVSAAMFFPQHFTHIGDFNLKQLIVPLLMIIMFGMGCSMSWRDFSEVVKAPKAVFIGLICQFSLMPIIGVSLALLSDLPPEIAAGIVLVGCSPSGLASNVMAFISGANLALSLTLTAVATLLAPLMTPLLMDLLADQFVAIDPIAMLLSIMKMVILPIIAGVLVNHFFKSNIKLINKVMPFVSMAGIALIITVITAAGRDALLTIGATLVVVVIIHNVSGYLLGYGLAKVAGLDEKSARTISFEVGMQNSGLASGLALTMDKVATMGLAPAVFGPFMNISGSGLAAWWRKSNERTDQSSVKQ